MSHASDEEEEDLGLDLFQEPEGYAAPEKPHTFQTVQLDNGAKYNLRLVGSNPLWGHYLWNGARAVSRHLLAHASSLIENKIILELGAGAGLPSLVCASHGARSVVVTDYPDAELIENLDYNIEHCELLPSARNIVARGYLWGAPVSELSMQARACGGEAAENAENSFDVVILADLQFNHSEHQKLMKTVKTSLARTSEARALVFFTPYRPWLLQKDLAFFELAAASPPEADEREAGEVFAKQERSLIVKKISGQVLEKVLFEEDPGDEVLRRTVFGYEMMWADLVR